MGKSVTVASKFTEEEIDKIDYFVAKNHTTRSALFHELVMNGVNGEENNDIITKGNSDIEEVTFRFLDDFAYFWKGRTYNGIINGDEVSMRFGGEWKTYKLDQLPVEIIH